MGILEQRLGQNEAIFRALNERVAELGGRFGSTSFEIVCECAEIECVARIGLTAEEYEWARASDTTFIVLPEHVVPRVEEVIRHGNGFVYVRKTGSAADAATDANPND